MRMDSTTPRSISFAFWGFAVAALAMFSTTASIARDE